MHPPPSSIFCEPKIDPAFRYIPTWLGKMLAFWGKVRNADKRVLVRNIETYLYNYGTSLHCNRFDVGNCIEMEFTRFVKSLGETAEHTTHAKRTDVVIAGAGPVSLKYTSGGAVTLHNVRSGVNTDFTVHPTIVLRPEGLYLLVTEELARRGMDVKDYLKDEKSSLSIKESIFKDIRGKAEHLHIPLPIRPFKKDCLAKNCFEMHYFANEILLNPSLSEDQKKTEAFEMMKRYLVAPPS
jgi:hypothetical protein